MRKLSVSVVLGFLVLLFFVVPYIVYDPFGVLRQENLFKRPSIPKNRDVFSTELLLKDNNFKRYNSFVFGSSRSIHFLSDDWRKYLSGEVEVFKYDASGETPFGIYGKVKLPMDAFDEMLNVMRQDKKNIGNQINFTLLEASGKGIVNQTATIEEIAEAMNYYNSIVS